MSYFLERAPLGVLVGYLNRVEEQLIPAKEWVHSEKILISMLETERLRREPELNVRTVQLLKDCMRQQEEALASRQFLLDEDQTLSEMFPVAKEYGSDVIRGMMRKIAKSGVFA